MRNANNALVIFSTIFLLTSCKKSDKVDYAAPPLVKQVKQFTIVYPLKDSSDNGSRYTIEYDEIRRYVGGKSYDSFTDETPYRIAYVVYGTDNVTIVESFYENITGSKNVFSVNSRGMCEGWFNVKLTYDKNDHLILKDYGGNNKVIYEWNNNNLTKVQIIDENESGGGIDTSVYLLDYYEDMIDKTRVIYELDVPWPGNFYFESLVMLLKPVFGQSSEGFLKSIKYSGYPESGSLDISYVRDEWGIPTKVIYSTSEGITNTINLEVEYRK